MQWGATIESTIKNFASRRWRGRRKSGPIKSCARPDVAERGTVTIHSSMPPPPSEVPPKPAPLTAHLLGVSLTFVLRDEHLIIHRNEYATSEPAISFPRADVTDVRVDPAGQLIDGKPAASLWLVLRD